MDKKMKKKWFENWFDSMYYHLLYQNRNDEEANLFIENLIKFLNPKKKSLFLDVACGTGRHSIKLNKKGFRVEGFDLSKKSLKKAKIHEKENLTFYIKDMRKLKVKNKYDIILNLFTSFGYFDNDKDNFLVSENMYNALKRKGYIIIDFFNTEKIIKQKKSKETKKIKNILFEIEKSHDSKFIYKKIKIIDKNKQYTFNEKVRLINKEKFVNYYKDFNVNLKAVFGDYSLNTYDPKVSDRLILIFQKIN